MGRAASPAWLVPGAAIPIPRGSSPGSPAVASARAPAHHPLRLGLMRLRLPSPQRIFAFQPWSKALSSGLPQSQFKPTRPRIEALAPPLHRCWSPPLCWLYPPLCCCSYRGRGRKAWVDCFRMQLSCRVFQLHTGGASPALATRLPAALAESFWRQQRQNWWQFWGQDGTAGAYLVMPIPRPVRLGAPARPPNSIEVDGSPGGRDQSAVAHPVESETPCDSPSTARPAAALS